MRTRPAVVLPDSDVFAVERQSRDGATVFVVRHFPRRDAKQACCEVAIAKSADETDFSALARANQEIEAKHDRPHP